MSLRSSVLIVASPRPRVGKTLLARLLVDFQIYNDREVAAFDLNARDSALAQFLPQHVTLADIVDIKGQMALFDRLVADDGVAKVVDVGHEAFESFVTVAGKIGFAEEARRRGLAPAVLFMTTPDLTSVEAYKALAVRMPQVTPVPVHNAILGNAQYRDNCSGVPPPRWCRCRSWRPRCENLPTSRRFHSHRRRRRPRSTFLSRNISNSRTGSAAFFWNCAKWNFGFFSRICSLRCKFSRD